MLLPSDRSSGGHRRRGLDDQFAAGRVVQLSDLGAAYTAGVLLTAEKIEAAAHHGRWPATVRSPPTATPAGTPTGGSRLPGPPGGGRRGARDDALHRRGGDPGRSAHAPGLTVRAGPPSGAGSAVVPAGGGWFRRRAAGRLRAGPAPEPLVEQRRGRGLDQPGSGAGTWPTLVSPALGPARARTGTGVALGPSGPGTCDPVPPG